MTKACSIDISPLVRELRQLLNLTQEQFAARLGVTVVTINRWENRRSRLSPLALRQIKTLLNELQNSPSDEQRKSSQTLLRQYFAED
ncbi:MAG: helix-turn-helix domain-containing protein [Leptolyngbyaceae cyanobacterium bins.349]|nr:helix-turn-helix domain-containing protein [Leptolyngbyaceae cyanobacterium bins.349]